MKFVVSKIMRLNWLSIHCLTPYAMFAVQRVDNKHCILDNMNLTFLNPSIIQDIAKTY
jgi:hypothetical protein